MTLVWVRARHVGGKSVMWIIRIENDENDAIRCQKKARKYNFFVEAHK